MSEIHEIYYTSKDKSHKSVHRNCHIALKDENEFQNLRFHNFTAMWLKCGVERHMIKFTHHKFRENWYSYFYIIFRSVIVSPDCVFYIIVRCE